MKKLLLIVPLIMLAGCASSGPSNYQLYAETQAKIAQAHAVAETARFNALAEIAKNGDAASKVAAVLSIQMSGGSNQQRQNQQVAPPETFADTALKWTSVLLPNFTQFYSINRNSAVAMRQSDNQAAIAVSTNQAFTGIATAGHNANSNIAASGFNAINQSNTAGFNALNTQSTNAFNALNTQSTNAFNALNTQNTSAFNSLQSVGIAGFNALKDTASKIQAPTPNITVQGNYNIGENSGNTGKIAGGAITDSTSTPTVVTQPAPTIVNPVVVTQPAPVIVEKTVTTTTNNTTQSSGTGK